MCTAMLISWEGTARNLRERVTLIITARSPIERLLEFKKERGWQKLQIYAGIKGDYARALRQRRRSRCPRPQYLHSQQWHSATSGAARWPTPTLHRQASAPPGIKAGIRRPDNDQVSSKPARPAGLC
jgi:predicted dithiol-disulfide oxidoreductase (DUF899 family)